MRPLNVPTDLRPSSATLSVSFTDRNGQFYNSSTEINVESKAHSIFIQTDKAMYKPSQTVNFRVIVVDSNMMPHRGSCDVQIKDAEGNKIKRWRAVELESGTLTLNLELSDQPVLGDWTIKATTDQGEVEEKTISIAKYVLPKFEVTLDAPTYILVRDSQLMVTIKTKYTFGNGVDGMATVSITNKNGAISTYDYRLRRYFYLDRTLELGSLPLVDGKVEVRLSRGQLTRISRLANGDELEISVNVTETLTGITRNQKETVKVLSYSERIEFLSASPATFKPGFPYTGFVSLIFIPSL
ncbi:CD109 antigen-like [Watersipora subatra]|uniref:CD109 antigen-like n=1 Tax=Watersipora subatra TaxID=2589382 RepID=UPI00355BC4DA